MSYYYTENKPASDNRHTVRYRRVKGREITVRDSFDWLAAKSGKLIYSIDGAEALFDGTADVSENINTDEPVSGRQLFDKFVIKTTESVFTLDDTVQGHVSAVQMHNATGYIIYTEEPQDGFSFHYCLDEVPSFGAALLRCVRSSGDRMLSYSTKAQCNCGGDAVLWDSMSELHGRLISILRLNIDGVVNEYDPEFLHDFRVSVRRLRSAMSIIKGAFTKELEDRFRGRFSYLGELTGRARDMDVYLGEIDGYEAYLPDSLKDGLNSVKEHFAAIRRSEYDKLKEYITSDEFDDLLSAWQKATSTRAEIGRKGFVRADKAAAKAIKKSFMLTDRLTASLFSGEGIQDIHSVRIAFKKLRYCIEFFTEHIGASRTENVLAELRNLQNCLGRYNDLCVQCGNMNDVMTGMTDPKTAAACGYILSVLTDEKKKERANCLELIKDFRDDRKHIMKTLRI